MPDTDGFSCHPTRVVSVAIRRNPATHVRQANRILNQLTWVVYDLRRDITEASSG